MVTKKRIAAQKQPSPTVADGNADAIDIDAVVATADQGPVTASTLFGRGLGISHRNPHGSNVLKKARDAYRSADEPRKELIREVAAAYSSWRRAAEQTPCRDTGAPGRFVSRQVSLYEGYRNLLDDARMDAFDSRGALQPSALEEFCYFLLKPLLDPYGDSIAVGHRDAFQGLYFTAKNFDDFNQLPTPNYPVGNIDFVIAKPVEAKMTTAAGSSGTTIYVAAVALECKTYLDRPRWIESDILAATIKRGFPGCLYIVVSEFLKLDLTNVNVLGSQIDKVYVLRRAKNVDRSIRRADRTGLKPLYAPAVEDLFCHVRDHLRSGWASPEAWESSGVLK